MSSGRMWVALPLLVGVGVGGLWWAMSPGPQPITAPVAAPKVAGKADEADRAKASRTTAAPGGAASSATGAAGVAGPGGGPPVTDPQELRRLAQEMRGQLDNGMQLPGNPMGAGGQAVPLEDPKVRFNREASNAVRRAELAAEDARARYKWDDATWEGVNTSLDRYDQKLAEIQKRFAIGALDAGAATTEMQVAARSVSDEIAKQVGEPAGSDLTKSIRGSEPPPPAEVDWWEGIPFEEWAAQMEAEQKAQK
jgi:hypothetical protein